jgi:hypothetical protein
MAIRTVVTGNILVDGWTILDLTTGSPKTGMTAPADVTLTLQRESSGTIIAASETVTMTEIGVTGRYYFSFTPANSGLYILYGLETNVTTYQRAFEFRYDVVSAGATFSPSYSNAFCAESDIERWIQHAIDGTTSPDDTEAAAFAESRAAILMTLLAKWGYTVTPSTVVAGSRLEDLLRRANSIGAALDYTVAQQFAKVPNLSDRPERLEILWQQLVGDPSDLDAKPGILEEEVKGNLSSLASDHALSGDTAARTETVAPTQEPIGITMGDTF